jgi:hypothetical protein
MEYLIDEYTFERLNLDEGKTYTEFVNWNTECLRTMSETDRALIRLLCGSIKSRNLRMVDADCGATTSVVEFYIDLKKRICLVNSR